MSASFTGQSEFSFMSGANSNMSEALARNWWAMALRGVLAIVFGVIALVLPGVTMLSLVIVFAAYALVDGVLAIVAAVRSARRHERWGLLVLEGVVDIAAGVLAFLWPGLTIVIFVLLVAAWAIVTGGLMTAAAFRLQLDHGRWWLALGGLASLGLWRPPDYRAADRRVGADLVARRVRARFWRSPAHPGVPASRQARRRPTRRLGSRGRLNSSERALALASRIAGFILPRPATFAGAAVRVAASAF